MFKLESDTGTSPKRVASMSVVPWTCLFVDGELYAPVTRVGAHRVLGVRS